MRFSLALFAALYLPVLVTPSNATHIDVKITPGLYTPRNFTASNGTTITFYFPTTSDPHSVTQGSFCDPCVYLNDTDGIGFDSGLQSGTNFTIQITNDQEPIWFFCKGPGHCGLGMVGAINAPTTGSETFAAYLATVKALGTKAPNDSYTGPVMGGVDAVVVASPPY